MYIKQGGSALKFPPASVATDSAAHTATQAADQGEVNKTTAGESKGAHGEVQRKPAPAAAAARSEEINSAHFRRTRTPSIERVEGEVMAQCFAKATAPEPPLWAKAKAEEINSAIKAMEQIASSSSSSRPRACRSRCPFCYAHDESYSECTLEDGHTGMCICLRCYQGQPEANTVATATAANT
jgi:hypothetical protein